MDGLFHIIDTEWIYNMQKLIQIFFRIIKKYEFTEPLVKPENDSFAGGYSFDFYMESGEVKSLNIINQTTLDISGQRLKIQNSVEFEIYQNMNQSIIEHGTIIKE